MQSMKTKWVIVDAMIFTEGNFQSGQIAGLGLWNTALKLHSEVKNIIAAHPGGKSQLQLSWRFGRSCKKKKTKHCSIVDRLNIWAMFTRVNYAIRYLIKPIQNWFIYIIKVEHVYCPSSCKGCWKVTELNMAVVWCRIYLDIGNRHRAEFPLHFCYPEKGTRVLNIKKQHYIWELCDAARNMGVKSLFSQIFFLFWWRPSSVFGNTDT